MKKIEYSTLFWDKTFARSESEFNKKFETNQHTQLKRTPMSWDTGWDELLRTALYGSGPDVSEVGTTWLGSLNDLEALKPLSAAQVGALGGPQSFVPAIWQACVSKEDAQVMAIPWYLDVRVVLYRRDLLHKAGVDEKTAFANSGQFTETLQRLKAAGNPTPLAMTTQTRIRMIHDMACWIWDAGGDFRSLDGRTLELNQPKSQAGMQAYFGLAKFLPPQMRGLTGGTAPEPFRQGQAAVAVLTNYDYANIRLGLVQEGLSPTIPEVIENLGVAMLMQAPFIGGSTLSIWRHTLQESEALDLIQYLTDTQAARMLYEAVQVLPARLEALDQLSLATDLYFPVIKHSLEKGRSFHSAYRWASVEAHLGRVIEQLWQDLFANPGLNVAAEVSRRFTELSERLEHTILANW